MKGLIIVLLLLASGASAKADDERWQRPLSVCDILVDPPKYNGKTVALRGRLRITDEGTWLVGENCRSSLVTKGYTWQMIVLLVDSANPDLPGNGNIQEDKKSLQAFDAILKRVGIRKRIIVTYFGVFQTYPDLSRRGAPNLAGEPVAVGFGHQGYAPAQLVVKSVLLKDLIIE